MRITKERLEHELVKLKSQFGPEHVGLRGELTDNRGNHCILGQIMVNNGATVSRFVLWGHNPTEWDKDENWDNDAIAMRHRMVSMNNYGMRWHQIIDTLVPPTAIDVVEVERELVEA